MIPLLDLRSNGLGFTRPETGTSDSLQKLRLIYAAGRVGCKPLFCGGPDAFNVDVFAHFAYLDHFEPAIM